MQPPVTREGADVRCRQSHTGLSQEVTGIQPTPSVWPQVNTHQTGCGPEDSQSTCRASDPRQILWSDAPTSSCGRPGRTALGNWARFLTGPGGTMSSRCHPHCCAFRATQCTRDGNLLRSPSIVRPMKARPDQTTFQRFGRRDNPGRYAASAHPALSLRSVGRC